MLSVKRRKSNQFWTGISTKFLKSLPNCRTDLAILLIFIFQPFLCSSSVSLVSAEWFPFLQLLAIYAGFAIICLLFVWDTKIATILRDWFCHLFAFFRIMCMECTWMTADWHSILRQPIKRIQYTVTAARTVTDGGTECTWYAVWRMLVWRSDLWVRQTAAQSITTL